MRYLERGNHEADYNSGTMSCALGALNLRMVGQDDAWGGGDELHRTTVNGPDMSHDSEADSTEMRCSTDMDPK